MVLGTKHVHVLRECELVIRAKTIPSFVSGLTPSSVLLHGPTGSGKKHLLHALRLSPFLHAPHIRVLHLDMESPDSSVLEALNSHAFDSTVIVVFITHARTPLPTFHPSHLLFASATSLLPCDLTLQVRPPDHEERTALLHHHHIETSLASATAGLGMAAIHQLVQSKGNPRVLDELNAKLSDEVKFSKVHGRELAGYASVRRRLAQLVEWQWNHAGKSSFEVESSLGILLHGPSGCGKTILAQSLAQHAAHFLQLKGSDVFSMYLGESEAKLRKFFARARSLAPCVLFLDEVDCLASRRVLGEASNSIGHRLLATLLNELDGVEDEMQGVLVVAACVHADSLDAALLRHGRLGNQIKVDLPDLEDLQGLVEVFTRGVQVQDRHALMQTWPAMLLGRTCQEVENMCEKACFLALKEGKGEVLNEFFERVSREGGGMGDGERRGGFDQGGREGGCLEGEEGCLEEVRGGEVFGGDEEITYDDL